VSRHSSSDGCVQPGLQYARSRWIRGKPVRTASARAKVLFPAPANPTTSTRVPIGCPTLFTGRSSVRRSSRMRRHLVHVRRVCASGHQKRSAIIDAASSNSSREGTFDQSASILNESPSKRGSTWRCACGTSWNAASPSARSRFVPSHFSPEARMAASSRFATLHIASHVSSDRSATCWMCSREMTIACPGFTGAMSITTTHVSSSYTRLRSASPATRSHKMHLCSRTIDRWYRQRPTGRRSPSRRSGVSWTCSVRSPL
jgi:hypothetical protein